MDGNTVVVVVAESFFAIASWSASTTMLLLRIKSLECLYRYGGPSNGGKRGLIGGAGTISHFVMSNNTTVTISTFS
jgi:hypothetical protein